MFQTCDRFLLALATRPTTRAIFSTIGLFSLMKGRTADALRLKTVVESQNCEVFFNNRLLAHFSTLQFSGVQHTSTLAGVACTNHIFSNKTGNTPDGIMSEHPSNRTLPFGYIIISLIRPQADALAIWQSVEISSNNIK